MKHNTEGQILNWRDLNKSNCPVAGALQVLGDKWTLLIIRDAFNGIKRFDDFCAQTGAPRAIVTSRLKHLIEAGILQLELYQEPGSRPRQQYVLTTKGLDLQHILIALREWGDSHVNEPGEHPLELVDKDSGESVHLGLVRSSDNTLIDGRYVRLRGGPGLSNR